MIWGFPSQGVQSMNCEQPHGKLGLISRRLFGLSHGINTLIAYGIAKHKMNVKGSRNNKKREEERGWKWLGLRL